MPPKSSKARAKPPAVAERMDTEEFFPPKPSSSEDKSGPEILLDPTAMDRPRDATGQLRIYARAAALLTLLAAYSHVSLLTMSPVYGSIPSEVQHFRVLTASCFAGWAGNLFLRRTLPVKTSTLLPYVAMFIPVVQFYLFPFSGKLGPALGPALTEGLTLGPLAFLSTACVGDILETADLSTLPDWIGDAAPGVGSWVFFKGMEGVVEKFLLANIGKSIMYTRIAMETMLAGSFALFAPSKWLIVTIPALIHVASVNTHVATPAATAALNETMQANGWMLMDRQESTTGYVSVLESMERGFRVMRCDHSVLGGEWTVFQGEKVNEPIYGVFAMLEAVRLVETNPPIRDEDAKALVIGLGIGTTPSALVTHGIDTTVVEIDPVVYDYATKYFGLKENNPAVIQDAVSYTSQLAESAPESLDYVVHDVFTGGAEPADLFTLEFMENLAKVLKPNGVVAINYAGDFSLPTPHVVVKTIGAVFPACRIFRESAKNQTAIDEGQADFTNMVIFCTKTAAAATSAQTGTEVAPLTFRKAVESDYLNSRARRVFLEPQHEILQSELVAYVPKVSKSKKKKPDDGILRKASISKVTKWHEQSAVGHWNVMRMVMPDWIWEEW